MADESLQERTEAPTPKRRQDSRTKGEVPRSQELGSAALLLGAGLLLRARADDTARELGGLLELSVRSAALPPAGADATAAWIRSLLLIGAGALMPLLLGLAGIGLLVAALQARGTLSLHPLRPKWERLAPHTNLKRLLGPKTLVDLVKALLKMLVIGVVVYASLSRAWSDLLALPQQAPAAIGALVGHYVVRVLLLAGLAMLAIAAADYAWQAWQHEKKLRMTREEVKRENKESDGDPLIRARLRAIGRSLTRSRMMRDVPSADVVITNPTHIAVALKYDPATSFAPVVLAMGQRKVAERIKRIAAEHGVPLVENRPLARALLSSARVGMPIPAELYVAVAEVLAWVLRRRRNAGIDTVVR